MALPTGPLPTKATRIAMCPPFWPITKTKARSTCEPPTRSQLESRVNDLELGSGRWMAATTTGIYSSTDQGKTWKGGRILGQQDFVSVRAEGSTVVAATRSSVLVSNDRGATWKQGALPSYVVSIRSAAIASDNQIVIASREGAFRSGDRCAPV